MRIQVIKKFCEENRLGNPMHVSKLTGGLMHKMFKVETNKGIYAIKMLNQEVIKRETSYSNFVLSETLA